MSLQRPALLPPTFLLSSSLSFSPSPSPSPSSPSPLSHSPDLRSVRPFLRSLSSKLQSLPTSPAQLPAWLSLLQSLEDSFSQTPQLFLRTFRHLTIEITAYLNDHNSTAILSFCNREFPKAVDRLRAPIPPPTAEEWRAFFPASTNISQFSDLFEIPSRTLSCRQFLQIARGLFRFVSANPKALFVSVSDFQYSNGILQRVVESLKNFVQTETAKSAFRTDFERICRSVRVFVLKENRETVVPEQPEIPRKTPAKSKASKVSKLPHWENPKRQLRLTGKLFEERWPFKLGRKGKNRKRVKGKKGEEVEVRKVVEVEEENGDSSEYNLASDVEMMKWEFEGGSELRDEGEEWESLASQDWSQELIGYHTDPLSFYSYSEGEEDG